MATEIQLSNYFNSVNYIDAAAASTSAPDANTTRIHTGDSEKMRVYVSYTGDPTAGNVVLWGWNGSGWFKGSTTALAPASGDQFFDLTAGFATRVALQLTGLTFTTAGTVTVDVEGVG